MLFRETTNDPDKFFDILPPEWQEDIVPYWPHYHGFARIFILVENKETLCGGIVFSSGSPDTEAYKEEAQRWYKAGYLYIAFLFVPEKYRGQQLGSEWILRLCTRFPEQPFWLSIEEPELAGFYEKNGFVKAKEVQGQYGMEWILVRDVGGGRSATEMSFILP